MASGCGIVEHLEVGPSAIVIGKYFLRFSFEHIGKDDSADVSQRIPNLIIGDLEVDLEAAFTAAVLTKGVAELAAREIQASADRQCSVIISLSQDTNWKAMCS